MGFVTVNRSQRCIAEHDVSQCREGNLWEALPILWPDRWI